MTETRLCSRCGAPLPAGSDDCPRCLLRLGLELPTRDPSGPTSAGADKPPARPVALPLEEVARRFPQLEILGLVGQGGMGVVYRARQPRLDRVVALKLLPPELTADGDFAERFLREARAMARLSHPHIVAVHDFGESEGLCWLIMEYVDGVNLREALRAGTLTPEKALALVPQMCEALQYAHDEGVVHRDIKPENVLLDKQGRVRIADFGLAKLAGRGDVTLTGERQVFGTPHYMAPEQMEAARDVDHRADIFSLGVVFYEMLTGKLPLGRFEPPSRRVAVDVRVDEIVLHALEHEPERRYQHAVDVKTDVESVAHGGEPQTARAEGGGAPAAPPGGAGAGGGTGLVTAGAAAGSLHSGTAAGGAALILCGFALLDFGAAVVVREDIVLTQDFATADGLQNSAVAAAVFGLILLWSGARRLFEAEGSGALGDDEAVGLELLAGLATGVAVAALLAGALGGFAPLAPALLATGGALMALEAAGLWLLRRWARRHPSHGRSIGVPFERSSRLRHEKEEARRARRRARGQDSDYRVLAGVVIGRKPAPVGGEPLPTPEPAPVAEPQRRRLHFFWLVWVGAAMLIWPTAAWIFAGQMAASGWDGVAAGAALLAATAWVFVQLWIMSSPALRDALRAEPAWLRAGRTLLAWPLVILGVLLLGAMVIENWEKGTESYRSDARLGQAFETGRNETASALAAVTGEPIQGFDRELVTGFDRSEPVPHEPELLGAMGALCLLAFGLVSALRFPGLAGWDTCWRPMLLAPLLLLVGLRLAGVWAEMNEPYRQQRSLVAVKGEQRFAMSVERASGHVESALRAAGLRAHAGQVARLWSTTGSQELGSEEVLAFEALEPWDRWDFTEGEPVRRQPHVVVRLVGRDDSCVALWDCGEVRPEQSESARWHDWMQRILGEAGGF